MLSFIYSLTAFIIALAILIAVHEYGHFITARLLNIRVLRFSIGFGKRLFSFRDKKNTEYALSVIPLGGYVKMLDEHEGNVKEEDKPYAFNLRPVSHRFAVVVAGPLFNLIFAVFAYWLMFIIGVVGLAPVLGNITPNSIADEAGLIPGQEIISVDSHNTNTWQDVATSLISRLGEEDPIFIQAKNTDGTISKHVLDITNWQFDANELDLTNSLGIAVATPFIEPKIGSVLPNEAASIAGLQANDKIIAVNATLVASWQEFVDVIKDNPNNLVHLTVERKGKELNIDATPKAKLSEDGKTYGFLGITVEPQSYPSDMIRTTRLSPLAAIKPALIQTYQFSALTLSFIKKMIFGDVSVKNLSGPISIAKGAGQSAKIGIEYFLNFLAIISISLGILNLLPIPVLDGGHLLYYVIEIITGKPVSLRVQALGFRLGMSLLFILMGVALYNDFARL